VNRQKIYKKILIKKDQPAMMRDGIKLYADLYYPEIDEPLPALVMRLPYDKTHGQDYVYPHPKRFAMHGYLVVVQDTRGRWKSEGEFYPFRHEMEDGYDTIEWVASLPQCNGKIGMYGFSYVGVSQLLAAASNPPHLKCICPAMTGSHFYEGWTYKNGAFALAFNLSWAMELAISDAHRWKKPNLERDLWEASSSIKKIYSQLPLDEIQILKDNQLAPYYFDWINHFQYDPYWNDFDFAAQCKRIEIPSMFIGGWYDVFRDGTLLNYDKTENSIMKKLIMGPWYHVPWVQKMGDIDFGENGNNILVDYHLKWFDYWLKGIPSELLNESQIKYFLMGLNKWCEAEVWPPKEIHQEKLFLHSIEGANSCFGDGSLNDTLPGDEAPDVFVYDPRSPVISIGGHSCCFPANAPMGPFDQQQNENQNQILVYSGKPLTERIFIAGNVEVELYVSSSVKSTDFTAKLIDVYPDGKAINILEGIWRLKNEASSLKVLETKLEQIVKIRFTLGNTCFMFEKGHRIRIEISSSDFPQWDRNTNSGNIPMKDDFSKVEVAVQTVHHDQLNPSFVILPIWNYEKILR